MKKTILLVTLFACLLSAGCAPTQNTGEVEALQSQVEELQSKLDSLQTPPEESQSAAVPAEEPPPAETNSAASSPEESPPIETGNSEKAVAEEPTIAGGTVESYDIAGLEAAVGSIVEKIATATVSGNAQTDRATFRELHNELEAVDDQLDRMEDLIEADVRSGALSRDDYRKLDLQLDTLDNQLDRAGDSLEFTFGVDD